MFQNRYEKLDKYLTKIVGQVGDISAHRNRNRNNEEKLLLEELKNYLPYYCEICELQKDKFINNYYKALISAAYRLLDMKDFSIIWAKKVDINMKINKADGLWHLLIILLRGDTPTKIKSANFQKEIDTIIENLNGNHEKLLKAATVLRDSAYDTVDPACLLCADIIAAIFK